MGQIGGARGEGLGLQRVQAPAAHGGAQALPPHTVAPAVQFDAQPTRPITAFMDAKHLNQRRFPSRFWLVYCLLLKLLPSIVAAGRYLHQLAEQSHRVVGALRIDETVTTHWSGVCENLRSEQATGDGFF